MAIEPISTVEMHTGGEPVRIITSGYPPIRGETILDKRAYARDHLDRYRRILMFEPRGHFDMYGALLVEPSLPGADLAVLFLHNEGYSTMCGHAVVALGRYAIDRKLVSVVEPVTQVGIECPCGLVEASVDVVNGRAGAVSFESVPSFLLHRDQTIDLPGVGPIRFDVAYGGAFYALANAGQFGLAFGRDRIRDFQDAATTLSKAVQAQLAITHPDHADLGYLYGSILTDGGDGKTGPSTNVCVFADAQVDRSPTGSGVTARIAAMFAKGEVARGEARQFRSITGSDFTATAVGETAVGPHPCVIVRVSGRAYYSGTASFTVEDDDPLREGFLVR